jgi:molybdate transport system substrate-binding protein
MAVHADDVRVAVATNFSGTIDRLAAHFAQDANAKVIVSKGSTGKLYAQIRLGAPYDVFLAADRERPAKLVEQGIARDGSQFTYAKGTLVLVTRNPACRGAKVELLAARRVALANPSLAPYGTAAREALVSLGLWEELEKRVAFGENIGQAHALFATGNADVALIAASQRQAGETVCPIDPSLHQPIRQDAVRLSDKRIAHRFLEFLQSADADAIIAADGYVTR